MVDLLRLGCVFFHTSTIFQKMRGMGGGVGEASEREVIDWGSVRWVFSVNVFTSLFLGDWPGVWSLGGGGVG